jgi:hypothetical protein
MVMLLLVACASDKEVSRSFYYWKPQFEIAGDDAKMLAALGSDKIYLKCFNLAWDNPTKSVKAKDVLKINASEIPVNLEIVPVAYIDNEIFKNMPVKDVDLLADEFFKVFSEFSDSASFSWAELQIDCDWNTDTRDQYFSFLNLLKARLRPIEQILSCSIRLRHIKSPDISGIPPVDRGMLLYYNMGSIDEPGTRNSIYDSEVAARYVSYIRSYRLPLDIALPVFTWGVHQRNGSVISVIQNLSLKETRESGMFVEKAKGLFVPLAGCYFKGSYFKESDRLRVEEISPGKSLKAAKQVKPFLKSQNISVALFHLDSANTSRYGQEAFEELYSVFE